MNVSCPGCQTVFRVDPAKVPVEGVRARCSVCAAVFPVDRPATAASAAPPVLPPLPPLPAAAVPTASVPVAPPPVLPAAPPVLSDVPAPPMAAPAPSRPGRRVVNPFLAQDPETRARRLARALISDLVVYQPAKRAEGLRDGTLRTLFEEDIKRCWEEYTDQVGLELATTTRHFTEALNEILADGQPVFT